jgi:hypothetical protein
MTIKKHSRPSFSRNENISPTHLFTLLLFLAAPFCSLSAEPPIVGAWQFGNGAANNSGVVVFLTNGIYFHAEDIIADVAEFDGMERGTYTWNESSGAFTATPIVDTNGDIGLNDPFVSVTVSGDMLTFTDNEGSQSIDRVFSATNSIVGGWQYGDGAANDSGIVVFLANGIYFQAEDTTAETTEFDGMERGTYSWNETSGTFTATPVVDTNGDIGLNDPINSVTVVGDSLKFTDSEGSERIQRVAYLPGTTMVAAGADEITIEFDGVLQESTSLLNWQDLSPQPSSPWTHTPGTTQGFYVARGK